MSSEQIKIKEERKEHAEQLREAARAITRVAESLSREHQVSTFKPSGDGSVSDIRSTGHPEKTTPCTSSSPKTTEKDSLKSREHEAVSGAPGSVDKLKTQEGKAKPIPLKKDFTEEPMKDRPIDDVPGLNKEVVKELKSKGITKAKHLLIKFLSFENDEAKFIEWFHLETGNKTTRPKACFNALKNWAEHHGL